MTFPTSDSGKAAIRALNFMLTASVNPRNTDFSITPKGMLLQTWHRLASLIAIETSEVDNSVTLLYNL